MTAQPSGEQRKRHRYTWLTIAVVLFLLIAYVSTYFRGGHVGEYSEWPHGTRTVDGYVGARLRAFETPLHWRAFIPLAWCEAKMTGREIILGSGSGKRDFRGTDIAIEQAFQPVGESRTEGARRKKKTTRVWIR